VVFEAWNGFFGGDAGLWVHPVGDADLGFGFLHGLGRLQARVVERLGVGLGFRERGERPVFLAPVAALPVEAVGALDEDRLVLLGGDLLVASRLALRLLRLLHTALG
jgi:hypothetical protein